MMPDTLEILDRLVGFDTVSDKSNLELIEFSEDFLKARGFRTTRISDPHQPKAGLFATLGPEGAGILLSAHSDVVSVAGQAWTRDPFRLTRDDGRLFGRGTTDMKGFLAAMLAAADKASKAPLTEPLKLAISYDEEVGCLGMRHMIDHLVPALGRPRLCIVGEPTEMQAAIGHKGKVSLRAICHGQAGHSAMAPDFVNALHPATDFVQELRFLQDRLAKTGPRDDAYACPYTTVHVGTLSGGQALNIVPDRAELTFELRYLASEVLADLLAQVADAARTVEERYRSHYADARVEVSKLSSYPGLEVAPDTEAVRYVQSIARSTSLGKVDFGTEAGFFDQLGIPTIVCGPGSMRDQGHKADEFLSVDELAACSAMLDRVIGDLAATER